MGDPAEITVKKVRTSSGSSSGLTRLHVYQTPRHSAASRNFSLDDPCWKIQCLEVLKTEVEEEEEEPAEVGGEGGEWG